MHEKQTDRKQTYNRLQKPCNTENTTSLKREVILDLPSTFLAYSPSSHQHHHLPQPETWKIFLFDEQIWRQSIFALSNFALKFHSHRPQAEDRQQPMLNARWVRTTMNPTIDSGTSVLYITRLSISEMCRLQNTSSLMQNSYRLISAMHSNIT